MSLIKEEDEERKNYLLQKDKITKRTVIIVAIVLIVCVIAVILSGIVLKV